MHDRIDRIRDRFERVDEQTRALARLTGMGCPSGCGACCHSPDVEASVAELLPMAQRLAREGRAQELLSELAQREAAGDGRCVRFVPDALDARRGRCASYADRPLVCRLFGFAARRDRRGQPELVVCKVLRETDPQATERAILHVRAGGQAALFGDHARGLAADLPGEGSRLLPINAALRQALERVLLRLRLGADEETPAPAPRPAPPADGGPDLPQRPRRGPRRAA